MNKLLAVALLLLINISNGFSESTPRPEYPRPQFERSEWINLNGTWTFQFDFGNSGKDRQLQSAEKFSKNITVPFCPESKLSGVEYTDFINPDRLEGKENSSALRSCGLSSRSIYRWPIHRTTHRRKFFILYGSDPLFQSRKHSQPDRIRERRTTFGFANNR